MLDIDRYSQSAARMRANAEACTEPELRERYLLVASAYEQLAEQARSPFLVHISPRRTLAR